MPDLPQSDDPPTEETEDPDVKHGGAQPVLWALLGLLLIGAFVLAPGAFSHFSDSPRSSTTDGDNTFRFFSS